MTDDARARHLHSIQECRIQLGKAEQAARVAREELAKASGLMVTGVGTWPIGSTAALAWDNIGHAHQELDMAVTSMGLANEQMGTYERSI